MRKEGTTEREGSDQGEGQRRVDTNATVEKGRLGQEYDGNGAQGQWRGKEGEEQVQERGRGRGGGACARAKG